MTPLRRIIDDLENECFRLDMALVHRGDEPALIASTMTAFQSALDFAQQRLDEIRPAPPAAVPETPEERIAHAVCPRCRMRGRLLWHYDAGTCVEQHGEPGWAKAKRLARDGEPTDF